jgi:hypothetical protein
MAADTVKPVPLDVAELIVTGAVPVDVNVSGSVEAVFTVTLPNVKLAALSVNCGLVAALPVPLRSTTAVLLVDELLWIINCPDAGPVAVGSKCTSRVTAWLGFKVTGNVAPDILNPLPVIVPELIVTGAVPVEVRVTGCFDDVFTVTLANVRLAVLSVNCGLATGKPVPPRLTTAVLLVAESLRIVNSPDVAPRVVGSNSTFNVNDWPGFNRSGNVTPDSVKPVPLNVAELTVTGAVPVEAKVTDCVDADPTVTLPNARLPVLTLSIGVALLPVSPAPPRPVIVPT